MSLNTQTPSSPPASQDQTPGRSDTTSPGHGELRCSIFAQRVSGCFPCIYSPSLSPGWLSGTMTVFLTFPPTLPASSSSSCSPSRPDNLQKFPAGRAPPPAHILPAEKLVGTPLGPPTCEHPPPRPASPGSFHSGPRPAGPRAGPPPTGPAALQVRSGRGEAGEGGREGGVGRSIGAGRGGWGRR